MNSRPIDPYVPLVLDIETVPDQRPGIVEHYKAAETPPANYKSDEAIEKWHRTVGDARGIKRWESTALSADVGEIVSIGCLLPGAFKGRPWVVYRINHAFKKPTQTQPTNERRLLAGFFRKLTARLKGAGLEGRMLRLIGHNIERFDFTFLENRLRIHSLAPPSYWPEHAGQRGRFYDTMLEWRGRYGDATGDRFISQTALAELMAVPHTCPDVDGGQVRALWDAGDYKTIRKYNAGDVLQACKIWRRMTFQDAIPADLAYSRKGRGDAGADDFLDGLEGSYV